MAWKIIAEPQGRNGETNINEAEARNKGGVVVFLTNETYGNKQEIGRVAFERSNSRNPRVSFKQQLKKTVDKAKDAVEALNSLMGDGELD